MRRISSGADRDLLLKVDGLAVRYATGAFGVNDLSLEVRAGEVVALLGRNGAGKTSSLRGIAGFLRSERVSVSGSVQFRGTDLCRQTPMKTYKHGLVLVQERDKIFPQLKVSEHLRLVSSGKAECLFEALDRLRESRAGYLSGGERQMLALEMAWRSDPSLLLVDELSLGLAPIIVQSLMRQVRALASERGIGVLIVEQDAVAALRIVDHAYVLGDGHVTWHGDASTTSAAELSEQFLGVATV
jgi:branched-chain amino acid transport system ATP-binding protein